MDIERAKLQIESLLTEYERTKEEFNTLQTITNDQILQNDTYFLSQFQRYLEHKDVPVENIDFIEQFSYIGKNDIIDIIDRRIKIVSAIRNLLNKHKISHYEKELLFQELSAFGRQKVSFFDGPVGLHLFKFLLYSLEIDANITLNERNAIENLDTFSKLKQAINAIDKPVNFWRWVRDNIVGYSSRDSFWNFILASTVSTDSNSLDFLDIWAKPEKKSELLFKDEKTTSRIAQSDFDGAITSSFTALETVAKKYLNVEQTNQVDKVVKDALSKIISEKYHHDIKFEKAAKILGSSFQSLEAGLREMRNAAGDAHATAALIDDKIANLHAKICDALIEFIEDSTE